MVQFNEPLVHIHVELPGVAVAVYEVIPPPLFAGATQETLIWPLPGVAAKSVGGPGIARIAKLIAGDVAEVKPPVEEIVAVTTQVPVLANVTTPVVALIVQIEDVEVAKVIDPVPIPALGVADIVGGVPVRR
jgi:hypothetical protein